MLTIDAEFVESRGIRGAFVTAVVGPSKPYEGELAGIDRIVPSRRPLRMLIDTGSTGSCVDSSVLADMEIPESGWEELICASREEEQRRTYDVSLWLPAGDGSLWVVSRGMRIMECHTARHGFFGIIGCDVLACGSLLYDGQNKSARLVLRLSENRDAASPLARKFPRLSVNSVARGNSKKQDLIQPQHPVSTRVHQPPNHKIVNSFDKSRALWL